MADVKPVVLSPTGQFRQIQTGDMIDPAFYNSTPTDAFLIDGGNATTDYTGVLRVDFGGAT